MKKFIITFLVGITALFPFLTAQCAENEELLKTLRKGMGDANQMSDIMQKINNADFIVAPYNEFIYEQLVPELEKSLSSFVENRDFVGSVHVENGEPMKDRYMRAADDFFMNSEGFLRLFDEIRPFREKLFKNFEGVKRTTEQKLAELGYTHDSILRSVQEAERNQEDKEALVDHLTDSINSRRDELDLFHFVKNLRAAEIDSIVDPFRERLVQEEKIFSELFERLIHAIQKRDLNLLKQLLQDDLNKRQFHEILSKEDIPRIDKGMQGHLNEEILRLKRELEVQTKEYSAWLNSHPESISAPDGNPKDEITAVNGGQKPRLQRIKDNVENAINKKLIDNVRRNPQNGSTTDIWDILKVAVPVLTVLVGFIITRRRKSKFSKYLKEVDKVYTEYKLKSKRLEAELYRLKDIINEDLKKGKIDEAAYSIVEKRIEKYMSEAREQEINDQFGGLPQNIKSNLHQMLKDGKITEKEFDRMLGVLENTTLSTSEKASLKNLFVNWKEKDK